MGADLGNVSTRYQDTSTSSSTDIIASVSSGATKVVDKIIGSSVIRRNNVVSKDTAGVIEKFGSPNVAKPSVQNVPPRAIFNPSPQELQDMTASAPDTAKDVVNNAVSTAKANPIVMYAAIGIGAILIYKYFIK